MSPKGDTGDWGVARLAARQFGVVSVRQLSALGIDQAAVKRRHRAGRLHRVHQGVYAVGHPGLATEARWMAAILACGSRPGWAGVPERQVDHSGGEPPEAVLHHWGAALSHRSAAVLWGLLPEASGSVCVSVRGTAGKRPRERVHVHRSRTLDASNVTSHRGMPVTTVVRTVADLERASRTRGCPATVPARELRQAIRQAETLGLPTGAGGLVEGTRSDLELEFLRLCRRHDLPLPELNVRIGSLEVDFLWRERRLVVETDGYRYHRGRAGFETDRERDLSLRALGYEVLRVSERQVAEHPRQISDVLAALLAEP